MSTQTIAAIATALSNSGISIIRISGNDSVNIIKKIFKSNYELEPNKIIYGKIYNNDDIIDEVLVSYFKEPKSFTGEDVCEINCHGGTQITREILELVLENGARIAEPGEFSKRAFLNGKMDLSQAEAVINLINAKTRTSARIASHQLEGKLSSKIKKLREDLIELLAHIEVSVDYPEYDYEEVENRHIIDILNRKIDEIDNLISTFDNGRIIKDGINVAILGKPNVGKSSLLNNLAEYDRAIVTDIAGTTRDIVEESINIGNYILNIADTAGIRDTKDLVEKIGVEKSISKLDEVDFVIYMLSPENEFDDYDKMILSKIQSKGIKFVVLINKMDKIKKSIFYNFMDVIKDNGIKEVIPVSIYNNEGIEELKKYIIKSFNKNDFDFEHELIVTNERHKNLLKESNNFLKNAINEVNFGQPIDIISIYIKKAAKTLGEIIGTDVSEDVVHKIFEKFCLGK